MFTYTSFEFDLPFFMFKSSLWLILVWNKRDFEPNNARTKILRTECTLFFTLTNNFFKWNCKMWWHLNTLWWISYWLFFNHKQLSSFSHDNSFSVDFSLVNFSAIFMGLRLKAVNFVQVTQHVSFPNAVSVVIVQRLQILLRKFALFVMKLETLKRALASAK